MEGRLGEAQGRGRPCWGWAIGERPPLRFPGCAVLDPGALALKKEGAQMPGVSHHQMPVAVSPANDDRALPYDSLNPHTTSGMKVLRVFAFYGWGN